MAAASPEIIVTEKIQAAIKDYAFRKKLKLSEVDFNLVSYTTKVINDITGEETEVEVKEPNDRLSVKVMIDYNITIKQFYEIEIFEKIVAKSNVFDEVKLIANKTTCKVFLNFKKGTILKYEEGFEDLLAEEIMKRKLKAGVLLGVFDMPRAMGLKDLIAKVRVHEEYTVLEDVNFLIAESLEPIHQIDDKIIYHYRRKRQKIQEKNSKARGFLSDILEDELILEYLKPQEGTPGRDCKGHFVPVKPPLEKYALTMKIGDGIQVIDEDEQVKYYSTKSGYLSLNKEEFCIKNEIEVQGLTFKKTGSIDADLSSEIQINVVEANYINDAVNGVNVDTKDIKISGNVGYGANILADTVDISGQVHKSSSIEGRKITIGRLKGSVKGSEVDIDLLEHGKIRGDIVRVKKAFGGLIIGKEVYIDELKSNTIIIASSFIEINNSTGEDNKLIIDPYARINRHDLSAKLSSIAGMEIELKKIAKLKLSIAHKLRSQHNMVKMIKKRMQELEGTRIEISSPMKMQYQKYELTVKEYKELQKKESKTEELLQAANKEIEEIGLEVEKGAIINHNRWFEHNKLIFKLSPGKELEYKPKMGEKIQKIYVSFLNDDPKLKIEKD